jgi:hypothetical protein
MATIRRRGHKYQVQVCKDRYKTVSATIQVYQLPEVGQKRLRLIWSAIPILHSRERHDRETLGSIP